VRETRRRDIEMDHGFSTFSGLGPNLPPARWQGTLWGDRVHEQFVAACRQPPYAHEGGDAGARLRDAGRRLWPCPQRPAAGADLDKYNSGTGNWGDYTRLLNRTIAARWRAWFGQPPQRDWAFACPAPWQPWPYVPPLMAGRRWWPHHLQPSVAADVRFAPRKMG